MPEDGFPNLFSVNLTMGQRRPYEFLSNSRCQWLGSQDMIEKNILEIL